MNAQQTLFPWKDDPTAIACNFAFGHLVQNLKIRLTVDGRLHAETLCAAIGLVAGFSAQRALFFDIEQANSEDMIFAKSGQSLDAKKLNKVGFKNGNNYFFGDPINNVLLAQNKSEASQKLWPLAAGAAIAAGLDMKALPNVGEYFANITRSLGGDMDGLSSVAKENQPHLAFRPLLKAVWPVAASCFSGKIAPTIERFGEAAMKWRPAIAATAANVFVREVANVLAPRTALTLAVEAGIYASKLDPESIAS